jgi:adenylosuccinate synthase
MAVLSACQPVYETLPGWTTGTAGVREYSALPEKTRAYVERLGDMVGCEIGLVSTGPDRNDTIVRATSALASWFA